MKRIGIISCNKYTNFTNYGTVLQSWALSKAVGNMGGVFLVDYCPDALLDKDPLNPFKNSWDKDEESMRMIQLTMPAIRENYKKIMDFYDHRFVNTKGKYNSSNFNQIKDEHIDGFICGSDTIFCYNEFGFDDIFFANNQLMREGFSMSYAASFGDTKPKDINMEILSALLNNFKYIGLRENTFLDFAIKNTNVPVQKVVDPTLLLKASEYDEITAERQLNDKYLLVYSRRYNKEMEQFADRLANERGLKVVEISLRANNANRHIMRYDAGVEEFLSLVKHAEYVVTNSFHGMIFSSVFNRDFSAFVREEGNVKIEELLDMLGLRNRLVTGDNACTSPIDYRKTEELITSEIIRSKRFLKEALSSIYAS